MVPDQQSTEIPQALEGVQDELKKSISESALAEAMKGLQPAGHVTTDKDYYATSKAALASTTK